MGLGLLPVGGYERISDDVRGKRRGEEGLGVERQRKDNITIAGLRGWELARHYRDNDVSAFKVNVVRPDFERLLADLDAGVIQGIVCYNLDRLARQPKDLERLIAIYDRLRMQGRPAVFASVQGDIDLGSDDGITMARVMVAFANKASRDTSRRVARQNLSLAEEGRLLGRVRPFGWLPDKVSINLTEATLLRSATEMLAHGRHLNEAVRLWNEKGALTPFGNPWVSTTVRNVLKSPRLVGWQSYKGELLRDDDGKPIQGIWEPILDETEWEGLQAWLKGNRRRAVAGARRAYMLSGIVKCGNCHQGLYGANDSRWGNSNRIRLWGQAQGLGVGERGRIADEVVKAYQAAHPGETPPEDGYFFYTCRSNVSGRKHCGKTTASGPRVDKLVGELIRRRLAERTVEGTAVQAWPGQSALDECQRQIRELMEAFDSGTPGNLIFPRVNPLTKQVEELEQERREWLATQQQDKAHATTTVEDWDRMGLEERRALAARYLEAVYVTPAGGRGQAFDARRLVPVWRVTA